MNDIMIDIETLGTGFNSVILSVGVVEFNPMNGETGNEYHWIIDPQSCIDIGMEMNYQTIEWWMKQSDEARAIFSSVNKITIQNAISNLSKIIGYKTRVWANSPSFDLTILKNACDKLKIEIPWKFWNEMDCRTLATMQPDIRWKEEYKNPTHNALEDYKLQIAYVSEIYQKLMK